MNKPRIYFVAKHDPRFPARWFCVGNWQHGIGSTPSLAYMDWEASIVNQCEKRRRLSYCFQRGWGDKMELSNGFYWEGTSSGGCKLRRDLEPISFGHINNHLRDKWTVFVWGGRTEEERLGAGGDFEQVFDTLEEAKAFLYTTARLEGHDD